MKPFSLVRLSLIAGPNDTGASHQERRQKLEPLFQGWLDPFVSGRVPNCSVLIALLAAGWPLGHGRKARFEVGPPLTEAGEVKGIEVANNKELNDLIGDGETPSTLLQALASAVPASGLRAKGQELTAISSR